MRRPWLVAVVALASIATLWTALATRPTPTPVAARKASPAIAAKDLVTEASPTALLIREAEKELLALCEERDRLLLDKRGLESSTMAQMRIEQTEMEIMKHIRDAHRYLNDAKPAQALVSFERAEAAILRVPSEIKRLSSFLQGVRAAQAKARAALSGASSPTSVADQHYLLAEGYFQRSDFNRAKAECQKAIQADPHHLAARALSHEVEYMMGNLSPR